ncbi:MAG: NTP transferase domain-containing protein [Gemmatimonadetes bacterium]|nr:NTP transferase domain-containing protein [Gemmatimonadota bacterium]
MTNEHTLVVLAAGAATRFGRLKQLTPVGPGGAALLDYSLYDAALAGYSRFVLVIREELRRAFDDHLAPAAAAGLDLRYAYQSLLHPGLVDTPPPGRSQPWGTGHALLAAAGELGGPSGPFALCNADDFYGRGAYAQLISAVRGAEVEAGAMAAEGEGRRALVLTVTYPMGATLSGSGGVSRGFCEVAPPDTLVRLTEGLKMRRSGDRVLGQDVEGRPVDVPLSTPVCTNLWGFVGRKASSDRLGAESVKHTANDAIFLLEGLFEEFLATDPGTDKEYYLSEAMNELIARDLVCVRVVPTDERWLGVTFPDDHGPVADALGAMVRAGVYPEHLWAR